MSEARSRVRWQHTSELLAALANANRGPHTPPYRASDFNPHQIAAPAGRPLSPQASVQALKEVFIHGS